MKQKKILSLTLSQLKQLYRHELPYVVQIALQCADVETFSRNIADYIEMHYDTATPEAANMLSLIAYNGRDIYELSTDRQIHVTTLSLLHNFLTDKLTEEIETDALIDLFMQFKRMQSPTLPQHASRQVVKTWMERWQSGLDEEVQQIRDRNKERILHILLQKIEHQKSTTSRYHFNEEMNYEEKYRKVSEWWNDFRFQLVMAAKSPTEINRLLGNTLSDETMYLLSRARKKGMPFFVTPYYLSLLNCTDSGYNDEALRSYILYSPQLVETYGQIRAWEREDVVEAGKPNAAGWLLPEGHNIHRRYPEVAILIPDTMGRACGGLCASCQRMYDFQSKRLNFEFDTLKPKETWEKKLRRLMNYFEEDTQLRDILITGGDALMSQNKTLANILDAVYRMALRKQKANLLRPEGEKYAELQRVRLGTRLPVYLPMRINDELVEILRTFRQKASDIGVSQFFIQTHFQTPLEITPQAREGIQQLLDAGWKVTNQLVFNVAASRRGHTAQLRRMLHELGVVCYYTFSVKGFEENNAVFAPCARSMQERCEEKHPMLSTDRNVLNLPGIGKSMTFKLVGITPEGKRILCFDHDANRRHSPIIGQMGKVYIVENKSIAAYLRQLGSMGENPEEYNSIWNYTEGKTEPRIGMYQYPDFPFRITDKMSNLRLT
ncbi:MAG: KamA family protein [Prevotellaceae bacterium]|jgi:lysine 2,3-aminomutase|nr:KamA family protein [Prevotellaceae bacterium]